MAVGDGVANSILDALFNQTNWTAPTAIHLSLHESDPGTTGAGECDDATYARVNVTTAFGNAASRAVSNTAAIEFAAFTAQQVITHYGLWSASTAGTFYHGGDVSPDKTVGAGEIPRFAIGELDITA